MSYLKIVPELFLGSEELNKFYEFIDTQAFRKNLLENTVGFGLIYSNNDTDFLNAKISQDTDLGLDKTIKWNEIRAIDSDGNFIYKQASGQLVIPNDSSWYWVKIRHAFSSIEKGIFSVSESGIVTSTGAQDLTKLLRGQPNFPSKIKFTNATSNTLEYEVVEVLSSSSLQLVGATFVAETDLQMEVVGTYTNKVVIDELNKFPFQYDSCTVSLVEEEFENEWQPPNIGYVPDKDFYLARIKRDGSDLIIQDKRIQYWKTISNEKLEDDFDSLGTNQVIGVEGVRFGLTSTSKEKSSVKIGWGIRTEDFSINTSSNFLTLNTIKESGLLKTSSAFVNGSVNGWRVYTINGKWRKIISSIKIGSSIRLTLDVLDIEDFSANGGDTFLEQEIVVVPNAEEIIIQCIPDELSEQDKYDLIAVQQTFPMQKAWADIELVNFGYTYGVEDSISSYKIYYQHKNFKNYSPVTQIPQDVTNGYYTEASYDEFGVLLGSGTTRRTYANPDRSILLLPPTNSFDTRIRILETGDKFGFQINQMTSDTTFGLVVGDNTINQYYFADNVSLSANVDIILYRIGTLKSGNKFRLVIRGKLNLNGYSFRIIDTTGEGDPYVHRIFTPMDMKMTNNYCGIVVDCVYSAEKAVTVTILGTPTVVYGQWLVTGYLEKLAGWRGIPIESVFGTQEVIEGTDLSAVTTGNDNVEEIDSLNIF